MIGDSGAVAIAQATNIMRLGMSNHTNYSADNRLSEEAKKRVRQCLPDIELYI